MAIHTDEENAIIVEAPAAAYQEATRLNNSMQLTQLFHFQILKVLPKLENLSMPYSIEMTVRQGKM